MKNGDLWDHILKHDTFLELVWSDFFFWQIGRRSIAMSALFAAARNFTLKWNWSRSYLLEIVLFIGVKSAHRFHFGHRVVRARLDWLVEKSTLSVILLFPLSLQSKPFLFNLVLAFLVHYGDEYFLDIAVDRTLPCGFDLFGYELFDLQLCLLDNHLLQYVVLVHFLQFLSEHIVLVG